MKEVYRARDLVQVTYYRDLLESAGVATLMRNESPTRVGMEVQGADFYPNLSVINEEDAEMAALLIRKDVARGLEEPGPQQKCQNCGEMNPGNFGQCFQCQAELPTVRLDSGKLVIIDNYDSFTYNLVQYFGELGVSMEVVRNDAVSVEDVRAMEPKRICISPGPCTPNEAGISCAVIKAFGPEIPVLGVCLGHQSIGQVYGGTVVRAETLMHGKTSEMHHGGKSVFAGLPNPFTATRYHSLIVKKESLPDCLEITAWTEDGTIMGLKHREFPVHGVQFHPESILTENGKDLLKNFLRI